MNNATKELWYPVEMPDADGRNKFAVVEGDPINGSPVGFYGDLVQGQHAVEDRARFVAKWSSQPW